MINDFLTGCCRVCEDEAVKRDPDPMAFTKRSFIVCKTCGNKRCPMASAHWQTCSGSNDDGQIGSFYGPRESWPTPLSDERVGTAGDPCSDSPRST